MTFNFWKPHEDEQLKRCVAEGKSSIKAALEFPERSPAACLKRATYLGCPFVQRGGTRPGSGPPPGKRLEEPWAAMSARKKAERAKILRKAEKLGVPVAYRPWADVVRDVERAA